MSASYVLGLPVVVTIDDDGRVTYEVDTAEASLELGYEYDAPVEHITAVESDHELRIPVEQRIARAKREILKDIDQGIVPTSVRSFSELHDYVDANEYGGWLPFDEDHHRERALDIIATMQDGIDRWLAAGRPDTVAP